METKKKAFRKCDICDVTVAIKDSLYFRTIIDYVVIGKEYTNFFGDGRCPMHICNYCWDEMKKRVKYNLPEKKKE